MGIRVLKGGMMTTVQDLGRTGYQSQGFSVSGVMDVRSFKIANLLLDNPENEAVLEFTLMGPTLEFTSETIISITGGDFRPQINGKPAKMYTAIYMHRGDILTFGGARTGTRGYIAFSSYLDVPVVMGSRSTNIKCQIGGYKGRKLEDEDYIAQVVEESLKSAAIWDEVKDKLDKSAMGLSGGQQQRLCIARTIAVSPEVILMDEPCSALDPLSTLNIENLIHKLKEKYTIVMVTHNMQQATRVSKYTSFFLNGEIIESGLTDQIFVNPKEQKTEEYITGRFG